MKLAPTSLAILVGMILATSVVFAAPPPPLGPNPPATDLMCTRCVHFSDMAYSAIKSITILNNSILNEDISLVAAIDPAKILGVAWTALNDGLGSGLDADFLDGLSSTQFLRSDISGVLNGNLDVSGGVTMAGNLGLGTTSPNKKLTAVGPGSNTAAMEIRDAGNNAWGNLLVLRTLGIGNNGAAMLFRNRDVKNWQVGGEDSGDGFQIRENGGDGEYGSGFGDTRLHIEEGGNVGIGTTAPGAKLEVADGGVLVNEGPIGNPFVKLIGNMVTEGLNIWYENDTGHSFIDNIYSGANLYLRTNNGATNGLTIMGNGSVATGGNLDVNGVATAGWLNALSGNSETNVELNNTGAGGQDWLIRSTNNASGHGGGKLVFDIGGVLKAAVTAAGDFYANGDVGGTRLCIGTDCRSVWPSGLSSGGNVSGSGTADRLAKWTAADTLGNSPVYIASGNVGVGTPSPSSLLDVQGDFSIKDEIAYPDPVLGDHSNGSIAGTIQYYINQGYGNIHLQPGDYYINNQITLNSNLTIEGAGWDSKIIMSSSNTSDGIAKDGSGNGIDNVVLKDFFIDSVSSARTSCIEIDGSEADRNTSILIEGLKVQDCGEHGIHVKGTNALIISNIVIENAGTSATEDHNMYLRRINNATISDVVSTGAAANGFNGNDLDGVSITNYVARNNGFRGIRISASSRITISNSQAIDNGEIGFMIQEEAGEYSYNVTLSGCVSYGNGGSGVRLGIGGAYYVITGCVLKNNGAYGVQLYSSPSDVVIDATVFDSNTSGAYTGATGSTIIGDISL